MNQKRCNLSGIYIFDTLEGDEKQMPTCLEDCRVETREKWLQAQNKECLINTIHLLCNTLKNISNEFGIVSE